MKKKIILYIIVLALIGLSAGLVEQIFANYWKEVFDFDAQRRGYMEIPRELPGVLMVFIIAGLSFLSDMKIKIIAQILAFGAGMYLAVANPVYYAMIIAVFVYQMGTHINMAVRNSVEISLTDGQNIGSKLGTFRAVSVAFTMISSGIVYIGFETGFFRWDSKIILPFLIGSVLVFIATIIMIYLNKIHKMPAKEKKVQFVFKKKYKFYYTLVILYGVQKQVLLVYGPWVLVDLLGIEVSKMALLTMIGSGVGIFFLPFIGKITDKYGIKKVFYIDAYSFILIYAVYAVMVTGFVLEFIPTSGWPVYTLFIVVILDKMSSQVGMARTVYLKKIIDCNDDFTPTVSLGVTLDHVVTIIAGVIGGIVWISFGPQYIFYFAILISLINLYVAVVVKDPDKQLSEVK